MRYLRAANVTGRCFSSGKNGDTMGCRRDAAPVVGVPANSVGVCPVPGARCPVAGARSLLRCLFTFFYRHIFLRPLHKNASGGLAPNNTLRPQKKTKLFERRALRCCSAIGGEIRTSMPTSENAHTHVCSMNRRAQQWHLGP